MNTEAWTTTFVLAAKKGLRRLKIRLQGLHSRVRRREINKTKK
jgi:hypothetical protein